MVRLKQESGDLYENKQLFRYLLGLILVAVLMKATGGSGFIAVPFVAFYAVFSGDIRKTLYCLIVVNCMVMGNSFFMPKDIVFAVANRGMMVVLGIALAAKIFGIRTHRAVRPLLWILPYIFYMIIPSAGGWDPMVSYLKLFLFLMIFLAYVGASKIALVMPQFDTRDLRAMILAAAVFFIIGSVLVIPFPGIAYMSPEEVIYKTSTVTLFKGLTWHSQTLGPLISALSVFLLGDLLFNIKKFNALYVFLLLLCPYLIYMTSSRTAMAVFLSGILALIFMFMNAHSVHKIWQRRVGSIVALVFLGVTFIAVIVPNVRNSAIRFAEKRSAAYATGESYFDKEYAMSTRQFLMDEEIENWKAKPWFGNGFQVSYQMQFEKREGLLSYLSAPIEKGVWVTAILEEGGVIGMILFCGFWIPAVIRLWSTHMYMTAALLLSIIVESMAEFCIFSMTSEGGFLWAMTFIAAVLDGKRSDLERNIDRRCFAYDNI